MNKETLMANHPDLYQAILDEGKASAAADQISALAAAREEGATAERARIQGVETAAEGVPGHEKLIAELKFDGKTTAGEAALQILGAEKQLRVGALAALTEGANPVVLAVETSATGEIGDESAPDATAPVAERAKHNWDKNAALRSEFTSLDAYSAYLAKQESGQVRILGKQ